MTFPQKLPMLASVTGNFSIEELVREVEQPRTVFEGKQCPFQCLLQQLLTNSKISPKLYRDKLLLL
jgi:hypothetical protein